MGNLLGKTPQRYRSVQAKGQAELEALATRPSYDSRVRAAAIWVRRLMPDLACGGEPCHFAVLAAIRLQTERGVGKVTAPMVRAGLVAYHAQRVQRGWVRPGEACVCGAGCDRSTT